MFVNICNVLFIILLKRIKNVEYNFANVFSNACQHWAFPEKVHTLLRITKFQGGLNFDGIPGGTVSENGYP